MIPPMLIARAFLLIALAASLLPAQSPTKTRNVILVTADGLRWQDLFGGMDPLLMNRKEAGMQAARALRLRLWDPSPERRRERLLPFFWTELAPRGVVLGNQNKHSSVRVTNCYRVSYPGYSEMLTGRTEDGVIRGNVNIQNPSETVLEFLRRKLELDARGVALFGTWELFHRIGERKPGSIFINAGLRDPEFPGVTPRLRELGRMQFQFRVPWEDERHDYVTFEMALEYLKTVKPRVLHLALGETDDWAHDKRYDRVLDSIAYFDGCLRELFRALESLPEYRGSTSVVITSDHGRGRRLEDWNDHGDQVGGADQVWLAVFGPDTPALGEAANVPEFYQRDIAPTILSLMGIDPGEMKGVQGSAIALVRK